MKPTRRSSLVLACASSIALLAALIGGCDSEVDVTSGGAGGSGSASTSTTMVACTRSAECGADQFCRADAGQCVAWKSAECQSSIGDPHADDAVVLGAVLPLSGGSDPLGRSMERAAELAQKEITELGSGLPPAAGGTARRPLALVVCDDESMSEKSATAAKHLGEIGIGAIVGPAYSGATTAVASTITVNAGVLLFSPSATSPALGSLDDEDLVWSAAPVDTLQAEAMAALEGPLEAAVKSELGITAVSAAILFKGDTYGSAVSSVLEQSLVLNGAGPNDPANTGKYLRADYGNADDPVTDPLKYADTVALVLQRKPHVIYVAGTGEGVTNVFAPIEEQWSEPSYRPRWVFSDGAQVPDLWQFVAAREAASAPGSADLGARVRGTVPGVSSPQFEVFVANFKSAFTDADPRLFGAAQTYDVVYMLALAAAAGGAPLSAGQTYVAGLGKLLPPGMKINVGGSSLSSAFGVLVSGQVLDLEGASGPLDFDPATGVTRADILVWCLSQDPSTQNASTPTSSGIVYRANSGTLDGSASASCD